jgi:hypothetical protein
MSKPYLHLLIMLACAGAVMSCTDPVRDRAIERLGGEQGAPQGPLHRAGQPCVLCHSDGGPASSAKFVIAGTIWESAAANAQGAANVRVFFVDANNPQRNYETNEAGNFYVPESEWPDLAFPFRTGILRDGKTVSMQSTINREGSCNFCHQPTPGSKFSYLGNDPRESIGQIYAPGGAATP